MQEYIIYPDDIVLRGCDENKQLINEQVKIVDYTVHIHSSHCNIVSNRDWIRVVIES